MPEPETAGELFNAEIERIEAEQRVWLEFERQRLIAEMMDAQVQAAGEAEIQAAMERLGEKIRANPEQFPTEFDPATTMAKLNFKPPEPDPRAVIIVILL